MSSSRILPAAFLLASGALGTAQSRLPISSADWIDESNEAGALLGYHVAGAGDVNGDGYDDVLIGALGRMFLHVGSATGLSPVPAWALDEGRPRARLYRAYAAGDVNGDGFDDVVGGDPFYAGISVDRGRALLFMGSASGLSSAPSWIAHGDRPAAFFGRALGSGDIDGDGFTDLAAMTSLLVQVFRGSAAGLETTPSWVLPSLGFLFAGGPTLEDLNGDGYADLALSSFESSNKVFPGENFAGRLFVYTGSEAGLGTGAESVLDLDLENGNLLPHVAGAGSVRGDGRGDLAVVMEGGVGPIFEPGLSKPESVLLFHGTKSSVGRHAGTVVAGVPNGTLVVESVGAGGDLNGDGHGDVIVPESFDPLYGSSLPPFHALLVFTGGNGGLGRTPATIIEPEQAGDGFPGAAARAGDVNGDGFGDLIVSGPEFSGGELREGCVYVFHGRASF